MAELIKYLEEKSIYKENGECLIELNQGVAAEITLYIKRKMPNLNITKTCAVKNNYLKAMYELKKEEYKVRYGVDVREMKMYHSTSENNALSIIKDNLDWRRVTRSKYGQGVSFSKDPDYANYQSNSRNGSSRAFIIADVLVSKICIGHKSLTVPADGTDTARSSNGYVYVKFNDHEFLPNYVVFYEEPNRATSKFFHNRSGWRWGF